MESGRRWIRNVLRRRGLEAESGHATTAEGGQMLVLMAGGLVVLLVIVGLVIDSGVAFLNRRDGQNVADLASMAGTKIVADYYTDGGRSGADVYAAIDKSVQANGCLASGAVPCTWTADYVSNTEAVVGSVASSGGIPAGTQGVQVHVTRTPRTFVLGVIGQTTWDVGTVATALTWSPPALPAGQVLPIAADPPATYELGETYDFTVGKDGPGNFGWISWTGSNDPNTLATSICTPDNPLIVFPQWIAGDPGKSNSSSVRACVQKWIDNGATVLIPIWDQTQGNGNSFQYRIVGLAAFVITAKSQPAIDQITGIFVGYYQLPSVPAGYGSPPTPEDDVVAINLIR